MMGICFGILQNLTDAQQDWFVGKITIESLFIKRPKFVSDVASIQMFRLTNTPICVLGKYE